MDSRIRANPVRMSARVRGALLTLAHMLAGIRRTDNESPNIGNNGVRKMHKKHETAIAIGRAATLEKSSLICARENFPSEELPRYGPTA